MKFLDLLRMSSSSLWKRKVRTILTVLGVVIGVASIVVMISLGLGLSRSLLERYESYGSVTQIEVYESYYYGGDSSSQEEKRLDDELIETISHMDHVKAVYPVLETGVIAKCGAYQNEYLNLYAMPIEAIEGLNMEVGDGSLPSAADDELTFFYGCQNIRDFTNSRGDGYYSTGELPDIDLMKDPVFVIFDREAYWNAQYPSESGTAVAPPKKYMIKTCGIEMTPEEGGTNWGWRTFCDIEKLIPELKRIFKNKVIPGQPSTKTGKPYKEIFYNQLIVDIDNMDNVTAVQALINEMGYQANSNAEWIESQQTTLGYVQMVLGGIGAVSLFVAAIGITNTMMMSIYERTKEIGVMKVLGCDLRNIRSLFLLEAGFIGFIGGVIGLALSYTLSIVINKVAAGADGGMMMTGSSISYIPLWLAGLALVFAVLVGMLAGFFPALRAMRLSPLAAIRTE
ncbi:MAG: ABC transporter permease [Clostridium sp.]|nr:ABC transporter permease [Clostridium sp.]